MSEQQPPAAALSPLKALAARDAAFHAWEPNPNRFIYSTGAVWNAAWAACESKGTAALALAACVAPLASLTSYDGEETLRANVYRCRFCDHEWRIDWTKRHESTCPVIRGREALAAARTALEGKP